MTRFETAIAVPEFLYFKITISKKQNFVNDSRVKFRKVAAFSVHQSCGTLMDAPKSVKHFTYFVLINLLDKPCYFVLVAKFADRATRKNQRFAV